jgi:hypothetical protein
MPVSQAAESLPDKLQRLEARLATAQNVGATPGELEAIEAEAHEAAAKASNASERIQARRILRRVRQLGLQPSATPATATPVVQAGHQEYVPAGTPVTGSTSALAAPLGSASSSTGAAAPGSPRLTRLAQLASRLAQYGAPESQMVNCDPALGVDPCNPVATGGTYYPAVGTPVMIGTMPVACPPPPTRHFLSLDALGWWVKGDSLPALVTTSPIGTPQDVAGVLGEPSTSVLFGNQSVNTGLRWGGRAQGGVWLDDFQTVALEGHYYGLATETTTFSRTSVFSDGSADDPILARPFFDADPLVNAQSALLVAFPDFDLSILEPVIVDIDGSINIQEQSRIQSAGGGVRYAVGPYTSPVRLFLMAGYRFFDLNESLIITNRSNLGEDPIPFLPDSAYIEVVDSFATRNIFNGGELGIGGELTRNRWTLGVDSRLALGNMNQQLTIDGDTSAVYDVFTASYVGGLLAQPTNIGTFTRNKFAMIPQLDVKLGFALFPRMRVTVGYNFTYVTNVIRPGGQVDLNVNTTQVAGMPLSGPAVPAAGFNDTSIWMQGFTTGLDMRF